MRHIKSVPEQRIKLIIIAMFIILGIYSCAEAQTNKYITQIGFEASFGQRSFTVNSNIGKINGMQAVHEGGSLGLVAGNKLFKAKIRVAGFYTSNANTPYTQELYETSVITNLYPLALIKRNNSRIQPYLTGGLVRDGIKFYGTYIEKQNIETGYDPYLGKIKQISAQGGVGIEYQLSSHLDFIHLFAEALYRTPVSMNSTVSDFSNTSLTKFSCISFGVSFGKRR